MSKIQKDITLYTEVERRYNHEKKITTELIRFNDATAKLLVDTSFLSNSEIQKKLIDRFNLSFVKIQSRMDYFLD